MNLVEANRSSYSSQQICQFYTSILKIYAVCWKLCILSPS